MRWQSWPESAVLPAYVSRSTRPDALAGMVGAVVRGKMIAGEPIRDDKLGPVSNGLLSSMLPAGKRAVAVRITAEKTAGGLILPNDRVDVLHTLESADKPEGQKDYATRTILTNIVVLAVDQTLNETNKDEKGKAKPVAIGKTVTLELDPRQAEVLDLRRSVGHDFAGPAFGGRQCRGDAPATEARAEGRGPARQRACRHPPRRQRRWPGRSPSRRSPEACHASSNAEVDGGPDGHSRGACCSRSLSWKRYGFPRSRSMPSARRLN